MDVPSHQIFSKAKGNKKVLGIIHPLLMKFRPDIITRGDKVLDFHLFEFTRSEDEVSGRDLISEGLSNLCNAERNLLATATKNILEVDEDSLGGLWSKVSNVFRIHSGSNTGFKHEIKVTRHGKSRLSAGRGWNFGHFLFCSFNHFPESKCFDLGSLHILCLQKSLRLLLGILHHGFIVTFLDTHISYSLTSLFQDNRGIENLIRTESELCFLAINHRI
mmetsp:Transcript_40232/g.97121  ORF Transcript_40232/g.97121 Transcript_40232/m.97121 type:complete len:219 (-) Transcript_40232:484-1140(-)